MSHPMQETTEGFSLSPQQRRLWQLQAAGGDYRAQAALLLEGELDAEALRQALASLLARHEVLRTVFRTPSGLKLPLQVILDQGNVEIEPLDLDDITPASLSNGAIDSVLAANGDGSVDLGNGPLLRARLATVGPSQHLLLLSLPALCGDARSLENMAADLGRFYADPQAVDEDDELLQYADYADWQNELLEEGEDGELAAAAAAAPPALPFQHPAPRASSGAGELRDVCFDVAGDLVSELEALAESWEVDLDDLLMAAWQGLYCRLSGHDRITLGYRFEGRDYDQLAPACGLFAKWLPIAAGGGRITAFKELVRGARQALEQAAEHQSAFIWSDSHPALGFEYEEVPPPFASGELSCRLLTRRVSAERFRLCLGCSRSEDHLSLRLGYDPALFESADIARLTRQYQRVLAQVVAEPGIALGALRLAGAATDERWLKEYNARSFTVPDVLVHQRFERHASRQAESPALVYEDRELSYRQLNEQANRMARWLRDRGCGPGSLVALLLPRSEQYVVAMLAVLKAGAAYVPLAPGQPRHRLRSMLSDLGSATLVTGGGGLLSELDLPAEIEVLDLDLEADAIARHDGNDLAARAKARDLAYVIFTSGSTGRPKGVAIEHAQLRSYAQALTERLDLPEGSSYATVSTFMADLGNTSIYGALTTGGCLHVISEERTTDAAALAEYLKLHAVDCLKIVPSHLQALMSAGSPEAFVPRRCLVLGGEALRLEWAQELRRLVPECELFNHYGPTETTVGVLTQKVSDLAEDPRCFSVPLGRPLANSRVYILNRAFEPVEEWSRGEIYLGGHGVARGYLGRRQQTAERFIPDVLSGLPGARLYRTGDLGRPLSTFTVEFAGRADEQVKIHGFRVELEEVRGALNQHPEVRDSVVRLLRDDSDREVLVAYYVSRQELDSAELRQFLSAYIQEETLPNAMAHLRRLPLTANGKIDHRALPGIEEIRSASGRGYLAPRTATEEEIATIWREVLELERIGVEDNFFELGGHSLLAIRLMSVVQERCGLALQLADLLAAPTVAGLATRVDRGHAELERSGVPAAALPTLTPDPDKRYEPFPLSDVQQAYWVGRSAAFALGNVSTHTYVELDSEAIDLRRLERALDRLIEHHDMLRAVVLPDGRQQVLAGVPGYRIELHDLSELDAEEVETRLLERRQIMSHEVLESDRWPLFKFAASRLPGGRYRMHISRDALVFDAWSSALIFTQLADLYTDLETELPTVEVTYRDYVLAERALADSEIYQRSWDYWQQRLDQLPMAPELPLAIDPSRLEQPRFVRRSARLDARRWDAVKQRAAGFGLSASGLVVAAFGEILARWSKNPHFLLNLTLFQRLPLHPRVEDIVGDFTALVLLEVDHSAPTPFVERAKQLQQRLWQDMDHGYITGVGVLRELARRHRRQGQVLAPVVLTSTLALSVSEESLNRRAVLGTLAHGVAVTSQVWLDHAVSEEAGELILNWNAVEDLFPAGLLDDMFSAYNGLLSALATEDAAWQAIRPVTLPPWQGGLLESVNATDASVPSGLLHAPFEARARQQPDAPAVISSRLELSYRELDQRSHDLARRLVAGGAGHNQLVAVVMERGWEQAVAVLGILRAGAAYLPVDAGLPQERVWHLLERGEVEQVVTQPWVESRTQWPDSVRRVVIHTEADAEVPGASDPEPASETDLAYVIFTSGSTGEPKGVAIEHRSALNTVLDVNQRFEVGAEDRVLALSALSFDLSVYDVFGVLAAGGALVMPEPEAQRDPARWNELIWQHRVTLWNTVPALLEMLVEFASIGDVQIGTLRQVLLSGDWIGLKLPDRLRALAPDASVTSLGGATEASIWSILFPVSEVDSTWTSVPYGKPMVNQSFHVLDRALEPCPVWVPGKLYIGGIGLAREYWRDSEKTAASFIDRPPIGRLYATGDLGRYLPDGNIEFMGRDDFQVKIRGHRIELGEIEAALDAHPAVHASVVSAVGERTKQRLVAYVVSGDPSEPAIEAPIERRPSELLTALEDRRAFARGQSGLRRFDTERTALPLAGSSAESAMLAAHRENTGAFVGKSITADQLARVFASLLQLRLDRLPVPKYRYPSAGHLYALQTYLYLKPDGVEGIEGGFYYYDPAAHRLVRISSAEIDREVFPGHDRRTVESAAGAVFFAAPMDVVASVYGERASDFCLLEAGYIGQLLRAEGASQGLGFRPLTAIDAKPLRSALELAPDATVLHALQLGSISDVVPDTRASDVESMLEARFMKPVGSWPSARAVSSKDPSQRLRVKLEQPGLRQWSADQPAVALQRPEPDRDLMAVYEWRRSHRHFRQERFASDDLGRLLSRLGRSSATSRPGYPSCGDLYPVHVYVYIKPERVEGVAAGTYYYAPESHQLVAMDADARLTSELVTPNNRPTFEQAAFVLFLVADPDAVEPLCGVLASDVCFLEAGYLSQLLMAEAPAEQLGLCPAGSARLDMLEPSLALEAGRHMVLHTLLGGRIAATDERLEAWVEDPLGQMAPPEEANAAMAGEGLQLATELSQFLEGKLPRYMVPSAFVALDALPLTANGKVDRKALPAPDAIVEPTKSYGEPRTETEKRLAALWQQLLEVEQIGIHDDFFDLGGHSLLAIRLLTEIKSELGVELSIQTIFDQPHLEALAAEIEVAEGISSDLKPPAIVPVSRDDDLPLSYTQERQWFLAQLDPNSSIHNHVAGARVSGNLQMAALERSLGEIVRRHEILRTTYAMVGGRAVQRIEPPQPMRLAIVDLGAVPESHRRSEVDRLVAREARLPFDLSRGPMLRVFLLRLEPSEHFLLFAFHHIAGDHWSAGLMTRELAALYRAYHASEQSPLPELKLQFADFAAWQRSWLKDRVLETHVSYWRQQLADAPPQLLLPTDRPRPARQTMVGARLPIGFDRELQGAFEELCREQGVTLYMGLLAGLKILLSHLSGQDDMVVGSPIAGRDQPEVEGLIGCFINALALRTRLSGDPTFVDLLGRVRETTVGAYRHQELPFGKLVEELKPKRDPSYTPVFQVVFNFQSPPPAAQLPDLTFELLDIDIGRAKYDFTLYLGPTDAGLRGVIEYNTDLFERGTVERMVGTLEALLNKVVAQPAIQLSSLLCSLTEREKEISDMKIKQMDQSKLKKLRGVRRRAINVSQESLVTTGFIEEGQTVPLVVRPKLPEVELAKWASKNLDWIEKHLLKHGALLFRGFGVDSAEAFSNFVNTITPDLVNYVEGSSPRIIVHDKVYTSTEYPPEYFISMHNELSYAHKWPGRIYFYCHKVAPKGGETPIADSRAVFQNLPAELRERFENKRVTYLRNLHGGQGAGLAWQTVFETDEQAAVEAYCREGNIDFEWTDDGGLRTRQDRPAVIAHPQTGEKVWFNQVDQWHPSNLEKDVAKALEATTAEADLPINATFGDGDPLDPEELETVRQAFRDTMVTFPWQEGDVLLGDNTLVAHGRMPFEGPRKVLVAMGGVVSLEDVGETA